MIRYYYKNLRAKKVNEVEEYHPGCWVNVQAPTEDEVAFLTKRFKLDPGHLEDALDPDEMPRIEKEGEITYVFVRYAYTNADKEYATAPLLMVVGPDTLITLTPGELTSLQSFLNGGKVDFATTQRTKLVLQLFNHIMGQYASYVNRIGRQIKAIRTRLKGHAIRNQDFIDFVQIEDELNEFLSALQPTTAILRRLLLGRHIALFEEDQDLVEDLLLNNEQSIESCRLHVKSIATIREAYSTISSNNLNNTMKILTAATVMITLPNVLFGMYGMNIQLPFQDASWAYMAILTVSLGLPLVVFLIARAKRVF